MSSVTMNDDQQQQWEDNAELYDQSIGDLGDDFHRTLIDPCVFDLVSDLGGRSVLDIGCGNGYLCRMVAARGAHEVVGIDYSHNLIMAARRRVKHDAVQFEISDLREPWPVQGGHFDVIIANMVLQYLPDIGHIAAECKRILKPAGKIVASIDHPTHAMIMRIARLLGVGKTKFLTDTEYFAEAICWKRSLWDKAILAYYHRPLASYVNPFLERGLALVGFKELGQKTAITQAVHEEIPRVVLVAYQTSH